MRRLVCIAGIIGLLAIPSAGQDTKRAYAGERHILELDGNSALPVKAIQGGTVTAPVLRQGAKKQPGPPTVTEFRVDLPLPAPKAMGDWVQATLKGQEARKNGAVIAVDHSLEARRRREFMNARITEIVIPALDASDKGAAGLVVKFAPEAVRDTAPSGKASGVGKDQASAKAQLSNFRLNIDGLDCSRVSKIDAITVKQSAKTTEGAGERRGAVKQSGVMEVSNFKVTLSSSIAKQWIDWHKSFVIEGKNDDTQERGGTLELLDPTLKNPVLRVRFFNLGILSVEDEGIGQGGEGAARTVAELYAERIEFEPVN